jgi:hydrogenase expression/formation protein HypD
LKNFSMLVSHVLVPPAMEAILSSPHNRVQGFLAAGHVCTVMGYRGVCAPRRQYRVPMVVTGFEPIDILQGILMCVQQLESGKFEVLNQYARSVARRQPASPGTDPSGVSSDPAQVAGHRGDPRSGLGLSRGFRRV